MTRFVTAGTIDLVAGSLDNGHNPLGIQWEDAMTMDQRDDVIEKAIEDALDGLNDRQARAIEGQMRENGADENPVPFDVVTTELLARRGIDPLAVAWLARINPGVSIHDDDMGDVIEIGDDAQSTAMEVGDGAWWHADSRLTVRGLPHSLVAAAQDRPLAEIVSHPVLDRYALIIADVATTEEGLAILTCQCNPPADGCMADMPGRPIGIEALLRIRGGMAGT